MSARRGILSPLLRCLVFNSFLEKFASTGFEVVDYADDILIIGREPFLDTVLEQLQEVYSHGVSRRGSVLIQIRLKSSSLGSTFV